MTFSAVGIHVRLFVFALLVLVSGYQCISQFLVSCCALAARQLHPWRFSLDFFSKSVTLWTALQIPLWNKPHLVFHHKVYEITLESKLHSAKCSLHKWAQHQSQLIRIVQIWPIFPPFSPHSGLILWELMHRGCVWVVTFCCNTVGQHG